jgi:Domain of unknown function (DUF4388)/PilZ domain
MAPTRLAMTNTDRRNAKRISYLCEVEWEGNGMNRINTRVNDLSVTGAFIDAMTCFAVGSMLRLKFRIRDVEIETTAEVRYSMPQVGMGVRFLDLRPEHIAALESLVEGKPLNQQSLPSGPLQPVLSGNFAVVSLFDVIQMIENSRLTGTLSIILPQTRGEVYFNEGQIAGANSGAFSDLEAVSKFLGATEGTFEFRKTEKPFDRTIHAVSNAGLLLDLIRVKDEESTVQKR